MSVWTAVSTRNDHPTWHPFSISGPPNHDPWRPTSANSKRTCSLSPLCLNVPFPSICSLKISPSHQICHIHVKSLHHYKLHSVFGPDEFGQGCGQEGGGEEERRGEEERKILSYYRKRQSFTFSKLAKNLSCIFLFTFFFSFLFSEMYYQTKMLLFRAIRANQFREVKMLM